MEFSERQEEELDALDAIYESDGRFVLQRCPGSIINVSITPAITGQPSYVSFTLSMTLPSGYPEEEALVVSVTGSHGIEDVDVKALQEMLVRVSMQAPGYERIFDVLTACDTWIEEHNVPPISLYDEIQQRDPGLDEPLPSTQMFQENVKTPELYPATAMWDSSYSIPCIPYEEQASPRVDIQVDLAEVAEWQINQGNKKSPVDSWTRINISDRSIKRLSVLGSGTYGTVYECVDIETGEKFAVKQMHNTSFSSTEMAAMDPAVQKELEVMTALDFPRIVRCFGYSATESGVFLLLEYMPRGSLAKNLELGGLLPKTVSKYCKHILQGLNYIHSKNIIHRDVSTSNILLSNSGGVKLSDFGTAYVPPSDKRRGQSGPNSLCGTWRFLAPEVACQGGKYDSKADIWSLGCCCVEMLTTRPAFEELAADSTARRNYVRGKLKLNTPTLPKHLSHPILMDFISLCLQQDPSKRPSAEELLRHQFIVSEGELESVLTTPRDSFDSILGAQMGSRFRDMFTDVQSVGHGGQGQVFRATHKVDGALYAVKRIRLKDTDAELIVREVEILAHSSHENIVRYYGAWKETVTLDDDDSFSESFESSDSELTSSSSLNAESRSLSEGASSSPSVSTSTRSRIGGDGGGYCYLFLQMEFCKTDLAKRLLQPLKPKTFWRMVHEMIQALHYLHTRQPKAIVHRDVKPQNVFLSTDGTVKVGDFGLSRIVPEGNEGAPDLSQHLFRGRNYPSKDHSMTKGAGTYFYASPEIKERKSYDERTDLYSLGVVIFEMLLCSEGVREITWFEKIKAKENFEKSGQFPENIESSWPKACSLVRQLMQEDPVKRPKIKDLVSSSDLPFAVRSSLLPEMQNALRSAHIKEEVSRWLFEAPRKSTTPVCKALPILGDASTMIKSDYVSETIEEALRLHGATRWSGSAVHTLNEEIPSGARLLDSQLSPVSIAGDLRSTLVSELFMLNISSRRAKRMCLRVWSNGNVLRYDFHGKSKELRQVPESSFDIASIGPCGGTEKLLNDCEALFCAVDVVKRLRLDVSVHVSHACVLPAFLAQHGVRAAEVSRVCWFIAQIHKLGWEKVKKGLEKSKLCDLEALASLEDDRHALSEVATDVREHRLWKRFESNPGVRPGLEEVAKLLKHLDALGISAMFDPTCSGVSSSVIGCSASVVFSVRSRHTVVATGGRYELPPRPNCISVSGTRFMVSEMSELVGLEACTMASAGATRPVNRFPVLVRSDVENPYCTLSVLHECWRDRISAIPIPAELPPQVLDQWLKSTVSPADAESMSASLVLNVDSPDSGWVSIEKRTGTSFAFVKRVMLRKVSDEVLRMLSFTNTRSSKVEQRQQRPSRVHFPVRVVESMNKKRQESFVKEVIGAVGNCVRELASRLHVVASTDYHIQQMLQVALSHCGVVESTSSASSDGGHSALSKTIADAYMATQRNSGIVALYSKKDSYWVVAPSSS